jgi:hypothetical protein
LAKRGLNRIIQKEFKFELETHLNKVLTTERI